MQTLKNTYLRLVASVMLGLAVLTGSVLVIAPSAQAIDCAVLPQSICGQADKKTNSTQDSAIFSLLKIVLQILTGLIGVAAVAGMVYAAILYTSAGDQQAQVQKAKTIITDIVIGLVAYALMFLALNWLVPGGVLK